MKYFNGYRHDYFTLSSENIPQVFPRIRPEELSINRPEFVEEILANIPPIPPGWEWTFSEAEFYEDRAVVRITAKPKEETK